MVGNFFNAQDFIGSLNDSIKKYKAGDPEKALDFGFLALESFKDEEDVSLEYVNTNYYETLACPRWKKNTVIILLSLMFNAFFFLFFKTLQESINKLSSFLYFNSISVT